MTVELSGADTSLDMGGVFSALWRRRWRMLALTVLTVVVAFGVLSFFPKLYESSSSLLVEARDNAFTRVAGDLPLSQGPSADVAISSQIELIKSRDTLLSVIDREGLRDDPEFNGARKSPFGIFMALIGRGDTVNSPDEEILGKVASQLTVIRQRDSQVISIYFRSTSPDRAAQVANAIAEVHLERRARQATDDTIEASKWLKTEIDGLRLKVTDAENKLAAFKVENGLFQADGATSLVNQEISDVTGQITATQERKNSAASRAALIQGLIDAGQPIDGVKDVRDSLVIQQLSEEKARLQGDRAQKLAALLPSHPDVKALTAQINELEKQILEEGRRVAEALKAEADIEGVLEEKLRAQLADAKQSASVATRGAVPLNELERDAAAQRELLETYLVRYRDATARSTSSSALPDVRIISVAAPSVSPASPKVALTLGAVAFVAFALQVGGILFGELLGGTHVVERGDQGKVSARRYLDDADNIDAFPDHAPINFSTEVQDATAAPVEGDAGGAVRSAMKAPIETAFVPIDAIGDDIIFVDAGAAEQVSEHADLIESSGQLAATRALGALSKDVASGNERLILLVTPGGHQDAHALASILVEIALDNGISTALVDAGSRRRSKEFGLSDLCSGRADFGDVVRRKTPENFAHVPWGQMPSLDMDSKKVPTLISALSDMYNFVLVQTGGSGPQSALSLFSKLNARVVVATSSDETVQAMAQKDKEIRALGFEMVDFITLPVQRAKSA